MSNGMLPRAAADSLRPSTPPVRRPGAVAGPLRLVVGVLAEESRLVISVAVFSAVLLWNLHVQINQDAWLALAGGRVVFQHGFPHHDWLTAWTAGRTWVDQAWLGQLSLFGVASLGGLRLLAAVHVVLITATFAAAIAVSRRLGGSSRSVLYLIPLVFPLLAESMWQVRTQSLAFPLFVAVFALLALDARAPSPRVFVVLPLLCVWANVHGSVVLGVALTVVRGLDLVAHGTRRRGAILVIAAPLCLLASPYGLHLVGYYRSTLLNPAFSAFVNEWQPTRFGVLTAAFFILLVGAGWLLGRSRTAVTRFGWLALAVTGISGLAAVRNLGYFTLVALMLLPSALDEAWPARRGRVPGRSLDAVISIAALAGVGIVALNVLGRPTDSLAAPNDPAAAAAVVRAVERSPGARVYADVRYADWLLWAQPSLAGRVAYDARFELLSRRQLAEIYTFDDPYGGSWRVASAGYPVLVLDRTDDAVAVRALERDPAAQVLFSSPELVVFRAPTGR
ncbi:MAG: hypothetical protein ACXVRJ_13585 [Gaiellaceae bacterium]